ncbi:MAG: tetratricopeptide repeat protein [Planctomycetota bacterium]
MYEVRCQCGQSTQVRPSLAGEIIQCGFCGERLAIPPLSTLRRFKELGEPAPASDLENDVAPKPDPEGPGLPESAFIHFHGTVGSKGRVSVSAIENYVGLMTNAIEEFVESLDPPAPIEIMISCALTPGNPASIWIETVPSGTLTNKISALLRSVQSLPVPAVRRGPVAFALYRRANRKLANKTSLRPFSSLLPKIEKRGADLILGNAASKMHRDVNPEATAWKRRVIDRIKRLFRSNRQDEISDEEIVYIRWNQWIESIEEDLDISGGRRFSSENDRLLHYLGQLVRKASESSEKQDWDGAIEHYTAAIEMCPECTPLLARRARAFRLSGNRQLSLADWNTAINAACHDPWLFYHRSEIYADLEAWPQAERDLDASINLAPFEPTFLLARSGIRFNQDDLEGSKNDLYRVIALDPSSGHALARLGWLLQSGDARDLDVAVRHLTRGIDLLPDSAEPLFQRALAYASQNKLELAMHDCETVIAKYPDHAPAHGIRGRLLQVQGEFEEAIEACTKSIELGWDAPIVYLARGFAYAATSQLDLALLDCNTVDEIDPDNPLCFQLRGMLSFHRGELETAMEAFAKARDLVPDWPEPREQLAMLHRINQDPNAAVEEQTVLVEQQPNCAAHYVNRAFAYAQLADFDNAQKDYDRSVDLEPENEQIIFLRGCYFMDRGLLDRALADFDRSLELAGDHDEARSRRASVLLQLKRPKEALEEYEKLISKYPDDPQAYSGHAFANQLMGNDQAAEQDFDQMRRLTPEDDLGTTIRSLFGRARALEQREQYEQAIEIADEIIELAPENPVGYEVRAWMHWCDEQYVEALDDYTELLRIADDHPNALNGRGHVQAEMGDWRLALDDLDKAIELGRENGQTQLLAYALNGRALALAGIGRREESARDYAESVTLCPDNAWAYYNRAMVLMKQGKDESAKELFQRAIQCDRPSLPKRKRQRAIQLLDQ